LSHRHDAWTFSDFFCEFLYRSICFRRSPFRRCVPEISFFAATFADGAIDQKLLNAVN
jgi:hypothetical protein